MIYGNQKAFHMAKSILPSTSREYSQWKRPLIHRETRRHNKQVLHNIMREYEFEDDEHFFDECESRINIMKDHRRGGDKLHHFIEWGKAITKDMPRDDRLPYMRSLLPDGVIGQHAYGHLKNEDHFMTENELKGREILRNRWVYRRPKPPCKLNYKDILYEIITRGYHEELNDYIHSRHHPYYGTYKYVNEFLGVDPDSGRSIIITKSILQEGTESIEARIVKGVHDIDAFLKDIRKNFRHPEWKDAIKDLAIAYQTCYGNWYKVIEALKAKRPNYFKP